MKKQLFAIVGVSLFLVFGVYFIRTEAKHNPALEPRGVCDPDRPFNPHTNGITHAAYPDGLCFPSYNNYLDNNAPARSDLTPLFGDERKFLLARKSEEAFDLFRQEVAVSPGDRLQFVAYVHNNGDPNHNADDGQTRSIAVNSRTGVSGFSYDQVLQTYATAPGTDFSISQFISADNTTPRTITDDVRIVTADKSKPIQLRYIALGSDVDGDGQPDPTARFKYGTPPKYRFFRASDFFERASGFGVPDTNTNSVFGSEDYRGFIYFAVDVVTPPPPKEVVCERIVMQPRSFSVTEPQNPVKFTIDVLPRDFKGEIIWSPADALQVSPDRRSATLTKRTPSTIVVVQSSDKQCRDEARPIPPTPPPPPPGGKCESIKVTPLEFDTPVNQVPIQIYEVKPANFNVKELIWSLSGGGKLDVFDDNLRAILFNPTPSSVVKITSKDGVCSFELKGKGHPPPPPPGSNECIDLVIDKNDFLLDYSLPQSFSVIKLVTSDAKPFTGTVTWSHLKEGTLVERVNGLRATFNNLTEKSVVNVSAFPAKTALCTKQLKAEKFKPPPPPPPQPQAELKKVSFEVKSRGNVIKKDQTAEFQITFRATAHPGSAMIKDSMRGTLFGSQGGEITLVKGAFGGKDFKVESKSGNLTYEIKECPKLLKGAAETPGTGDYSLSIPPPPPICYEGSPFSDTGLTVKNLTLAPIIVTYQGKLTKSQINKEYCRTQLDRSFCGEKFVNEATDSFSNRVSDSLFTPCPFLLTRGIGDVILEKDLSVGVDIASCGEVNIEGPTVTPSPPVSPRVPKTGAGDALNIPPHTLCQQSNVGGANVPEAYRNPLKSVSSAVCELSLTLAERLTPPAIRADVLENITRITRFNNNLGTGNVTVFDLNKPTLLGQSPNPNFEVYKLKDGTLTLDASLPVGPGAKTYVVENGDLIIKQNITYSQTTYDLNSPQTIPSIAFVVINGSIKIDPQVTEVNGIFITLKGDGAKARSGGGTLVGTAPSEKELKINGTVYGDIEPLFESRSFVGSARRGQGTIVINYDGRLFYNVPPGLKEILDLSQEQVVR